MFVNKPPKHEWLTFLAPALALPSWDHADRDDLDGRDDRDGRDGRDDPDDLDDPDGRDESVDWGTWWVRDLPVHTPRSPHSHKRGSQFDWDTTGQQAAFREECIHQEESNSYMDISVQDWPYSSEE